MLTHALALALPFTMITGVAGATDIAPSRPAATAGTFMPYRPGSTAITYDPAVVPAGATATLTITTTGYGTEVALAVTGLTANRMYGAHLHTAPCAADPDAAGPHYQNHPDPVTPSVNPVYANPRNEIWLDFTADTTGAATTSVHHGWSFRPSAPPRSVVLHAEHTHTAAGEAGKAGARLACLTLP
ncbi:superoxide dismutase family protein [Actinoplanes sp. NPDC026619]|uniref:superoxide dismutase family protein n=1 Tax=Actinoplanes sp. NPDC026619 TaxID=3155798 RepID=UPI0033DA87FC